jgi:hypothetical protein
MGLSRNSTFGGRSRRRSRRVRHKKGHRTRVRHHVGRGRRSYRRHTRRRRRRHRGGGWTSVDSPAVAQVGYPWKGDPASWPGVQAAQGLTSGCKGITESNYYGKNNKVVDPPRPSNDCLAGGRRTRRRRGGRRRMRGGSGGRNRLFPEDITIAYRNAINTPSSVANTWSGKLNAANLDASPWNQPIGSADMRNVYAGVDLPSYLESAQQQLPRIPS